MPTPDLQALIELSDLQVSRAVNVWFEKTPDAMAPDDLLPDHMARMRRAIKAAAPTQPGAGGGEWPARFGCNGPEGSFWTNDSALANKLIAATYDRDEWTVTDTASITASPSQQGG